MRKPAHQTLLHAKAMQDLAKQRLQPPHDLPEPQRLIWHETVDFLPSDWFSREQSALLVAYTNHVVRLAKIEAALNDLDPVNDIDVFDKLSRLAAGESAKLLAHGRAMRLTVQSRLKAETAHAHAGAAAGAAMVLDDDFDGLLA